MRPIEVRNKISESCKRNGVGKIKGLLIILFILVLLSFVLWFSLPKKIVAEDTLENYTPFGMTYSSYSANLYFERFERALGITLPCHPIDGEKIEPCLTQNIEAILDAIE